MKINILGKILVLLFVIIINIPILYVWNTSRNLNNREVTLSFVGDLMSFDFFYYGGEKMFFKKFNIMLEDTKPYLTNSDITIGNMEAPITKSYDVKGERLRFNAYPYYLTLLTNHGFDVVSIANNHICDQNEIGIIKTISNLDYYGIKHMGVHKDRSNRILYIEEKGIKFAFISYTYGINGRTNGKDYVNLIDSTFSYHKDMYDDIMESKKKSDVIIFLPHWGDEYQTNYTPWQRKLSEKLIDWGVNIIVGSHPHVQQPIEMVETEKGNKGFVAYSLGNFIGAKRTPIEARIGRILTFSVTKKTTKIKQILTTVTLHSIVSGYTQYKIYCVKLKIY